MDPKDLKLQNSGMHCIDVDESEKAISVIVPEGWDLHVMPSDSGQELRERVVPFGKLITPERVRPAPVLELGNDGHGTIVGCEINEPHRDRE